MSKRKSDKRGPGKATSDASLEPPPPSTAERNAIDEARSRVRKRRPRFRLNAAVLKSSNQIAPPHSDAEGWEARLQDAFGTSGRAFATAELGRLFRAATMKDGKLDNVRLDSLIAVIDGVRPANEIEAMLASQLAVTHSLALDFLIRAKNADQIPQFDSAGRMAAKLLVAFAGHVELLTKLQRGGNQTVRVEHVHVYPGGQAIVGNVNTGGRDAGKSEHQPHAPEAGDGAARHLTAEQRPALPCQDTIGEPLPSSSGEGQMPVPDARRRDW